jgi:signal peptidase I
MRLQINDSHITGDVIKEFLFDREKSLTFVVKSNSMYPTIKKNEVVFVRMLEQGEKLKKGMICVFAMNGILAVHRLVKIENNNATFCGDNVVRQERINLKNILGICIIKEKKIKTNSITLLNIIAYYLPFLDVLMFFIKKIIFKIGGNK